MKQHPHTNESNCLHKTALVVGSDAEFVEEVFFHLPGWEIARVSDNLAALALVESRHFDLILTGAETSGKADVELLSKIRRIRAHTRLIILTLESTPEDVIDAMREHAFSYFSMPCSPDALADMIHLATEGPCWDDGIEILSATPEWTRLIARCDRATAARLLQFFHEIVDLPEPEKDNVATAFHEMLVNAIEYGGRFDPNQWVEISYLRAQHLVMCRVKDPGEGFSLEELQHAATSNPPDDPIRHQTYRDAKGLRPGGFGVLLTRSLVDEVIYGEKGNDVLLLKYLDHASKPQARLAGAWLMLMLLILLSGNARSQTKLQSTMLAINGISGPAEIIQEAGRTFVDVGALAQIANGNVSFQQNRIVLTLPAAHEASDAVGDSSTQTSETGLSRDFMKAGIEALASLREWASPLAYAIQNGYQVSEDWVANYREPATHDLRLAEIAASTPADHSAMQLLNNEFNAVRGWSDRLVQERKTMNSAKYSLSPDALRQDPQSQKIIGCGHFLASMLAGGSFQDDPSCH